MEESLDGSGGHVEATVVRRAVLLRLVALADDLDVLRAEVGALPDDDAEPLVDLRAWNVADVIRRARAGDLTADELRIWAQLVELRSDVRTDEHAAEAIFELATPAHVAPLNRAVMDGLLALLERR